MASASRREGAAAPGRRGEPRDERPAPRLTDAEIDRIVEALEERILAELDRRGGRFAGRI
jgi:hypothetical protein